MKMYIILSLVILFSIVGCSQEFKEFNKQANKDLVSLTDERIVCRDSNKDKKELEDVKSYIKENLKQSIEYLPKTYDSKTGCPRIYDVENVKVVVSEYNTSTGEARYNAKLYYNYGSKFYDEIHFFQLLVFPQALFGTYMKEYTNPIMLEKQLQYWYDFEFQYLISDKFLRMWREHTMDFLDDGKVRVVR